MRVILGRQVKGVVFDFSTGTGVYSVPCGHMPLSEPLYPPTKQFSFYPSLWFQKHKIIKTYGKTNNRGRVSPSAPGPRLLAAPLLLPSQLCSSYLFVMETHKQLLLLPSSHSTGQELGVCGSFVPKVCYSENELSGPGVGNMWVFSISLF